MQTLYDILFFTCTFLVFVLIIGIIRPHLILFWTENKDRSVVLKVFGPIVIVLLIALFITSNYRESSFKDDENLDAEKQERADPNRENPNADFDGD